MEAKLAQIQEEDDGLIMSEEEGEIFDNQ